LKEGNVPSGAKFPVLQQFGIPLDNEQTTKLLLQELQKAQEAQGILPPSTKFLRRMPNSDYIRVPKSSSARTQQAFSNTASKMIEWNSTETRSGCVSTLLRRLDKAYPDNCLQVAQERGYSTQLTTKMSAEFWSAMREDTNLNTGQQPTDKYLL
jgi:hypothetical protein